VQIPFFNVEQGMEKKILVAGVGNLLFSDEGVGVHVARELSKMSLPEEVELADVGTATFELTRLMDGKDKVVIVDAILTDDAPGTIYRLTPDDLKSRRKELAASLHQFGVLEALQCRIADAGRPQVVILAVVPKDYYTLATDLTPELKSRLDSIVSEVLKEIN
jgi:hydrogenase maturation protease